MKTLTDLKRDLQIGRQIRRLQGPTPDKNFIPRFVVKVQSNGIYFNPDQTAKNGSWLEYPPASLMEYDGTTLSIFDFGQRDLTPEEKATIDNQPSNRPENRKQLENDMLSDGGTMYRADCRYYRDCNAEYLMGHDWQKGLKYNCRTQKVWDKKIRGNVSLKYEIGA